MMSKGEEMNYIDPNELMPDPSQPRIRITDDDTNALAETYKSQGLISPVEIDENNVIVLGERRWRAALKAGLDKIPYTRKVGLNSAERLERQIVEEVFKIDWSPTERAWAYATAIININEEIKAEKEGRPQRTYSIKKAKALPKEHLTTLLDAIKDNESGGYFQSGQAALADKINVPQSTISDFLSIVLADGETQEAVQTYWESGRVAGVPATYVYELKKTKNDKVRKSLEKLVRDGRFNRRDDIRKTIKDLHASELEVDEQIEILNTADISTTEDMPDFIEKNITDKIKEREIETLLDKQELRDFGKKIGDTVKRSLSEFNELEQEKAGIRRLVTNRGTLELLLKQMEKGDIFCPSHPNAVLVWSCGDTIEKSLDFLKKLLDE